MNKRGAGRNLFFYKVEVWKTTWLFRFGLIILLTTGFFLTRESISEKLANSLVCWNPIKISDAVIIENFDPDYLLFEETAKLVRADQVGRVFVPVKFNRRRTAPDDFSQGVVEVMCRISRIFEYEMIPTDGGEPIRFNTAIQIKNYLQNEEISSIIVVSSGFSSRRAFLVYQEVFSPIDVKVYCLPVFSVRNPSNWTESWHGIQEVFLEFGKLWYYRLWVLG